MRQQIHELRARVTNHDFTLLVVEKDRSGQSVPAGPVQGRKLLDSEPFPLETPPEDRDPTLPTKEPLDRDAERNP
jgi:hypothetical protein